MLKYNVKDAPFPGAVPFFSPAKLNLFFRVLHKRDDGFHEILSDYQAISLCDTLWVSFTSQDQFSCTDPQLSLGESNLVTRALALFREKMGCSKAFRIHLEKRIPQEAGLGGGSSNAATALWAFCQLAGIDPDPDLLKRLGSHLGSDVPFFFSLGSAHVSGRGDVVQEASFPVPPSFWIAKPKWGLATPKVYAAMGTFLGKGARASPFYNDLEGPAFFLSPPLEELKKKLQAKGFTSVTLCGSGTALFCVGEVDPPTLPDVDFFLVRPIYREAKSWYE